MNTTQRLREVCKNITYKLGCVFTVDDDNDQINIILTRTEPDARSPEQLAEVHFNLLILKAELESLSDAELVNLLYEVAKGSELHEVDEWFKFRGIRVHDPHPDVPQ
ncbi:MAG TPA: hypothetical protein VGD59_05720 [Acidisarcina sp.]